MIIYIMDLRRVIPLTRTFSKIIHGAYALVKKLKARTYTLEQKVNFGHDFETDISST